MLTLLVVSNALENTEASSASSFHLFPKLPTEIQQLIWDVASIIIPKSSPSIYAIAPDPENYFEDFTKTFRLVERAKEDPQLKILRERSFLVPSLLHVSQESRRAALREYSLWPTAAMSLAKYPDTKRDGKNIYVNKKHDIFYFGEDMSEYWFLDLLDSCCYDESGINWEEWMEIGKPAFEKFLQQINGARHLALDFHTWQCALCWDHCGKWLHKLLWLTDLTVVIKGWDPNTYQNVTKRGTPLKFVDIIPDTIRAESAKKILKWSRKKLAPSHLVALDQSLPEMHVVALYSSDQDDNSSEADKHFASQLRANYGSSTGCGEDSD
jgi:hypothetical protein